jgi:hypothetical protein
MGLGTGRGRVQRRFVITWGSPQRSAILPRGCKLVDHFNQGTARLALDAGGLELCGRDGGLEFSGPEDRLRSGIDEINIQPVASVLVHAPESE